MRLVGLVVLLLASQAFLSLAESIKEISSKNLQQEASTEATAAASTVRQSVTQQSVAANPSSSTVADSTQAESLITGDVADDGPGASSDASEVLGGVAAAAGQVRVAGTGNDARYKRVSSAKAEGKSTSGSVDDDNSADDEADDEDSSSDSGGKSGSGKSSSNKGSGKSGDGTAGKTSKHGKVVASCPLWPASSTDQGLTTTDRPAALSIFSELTVDEYNAVLNYLYSHDKLGLIDIISADPNKTLTVANYVHAIHLEAPPKHEVLEYLDNHGPRPARKARAILVMGNAKKPVVREVLVTLHDEENTITVNDLQNVDIHSSKVATIPYNQRPQGPLDENGVVTALLDAQDTLNQVFKQAFHGFTYGEDCDEKCIDYSLTYSQRFLAAGVQRASYVQLYWYTEADGVDAGNYLHPIPVQLLIGSSGDRLEDWSIIRIWFAGKFFDSPDELLEAWKHDTKGIRSNFPWDFPEGDEALYATFKKRPGKKRGAEQPVGPIPWEPYGRRFTVSHGNRVDWLGWSLYAGYLPHYGGRFWDINFKGERIAYELSLQEAMALYGATDLTQANTVFLDSAFGMGYNLRELAQGLDCPMTAAFMDANIFYAGMSGPTTYKNAICIFEHNPNMPLLRHYSQAFKYYGAVAGAQLVVRMISTVYNYDYIQDLMLNIDGTIDVRVTTSGYIQSTPFRSFYPHHFGFPLATNVSGTVHTHVLAWKADLDIAGTQNSLNLLDFKSATYDNGLGGEIFMNKFDAHLVETEDESGYVQKMHDPKMPIIINENEHNEWGSPRGYKIQLNRPLTNLEPKSYPRSAGLGFWNWNFVATKRSEHESHSSSIYTQSDLASPPTSLPNYVDGESIRKKDLVVWVNSGLYHVPMAEDAPVTPSSGHNTLGFSLIPYNWANENPATDMADIWAVDAESVNSTVPAVKKVLHKCKPNYTPVRFATTGFDGITNTDEEVAIMGGADAEDTTSDGESDGSADGAKGNRDATAGGKRGGNRVVRRHPKKSNKQDGVTAVTPGTSDRDLPLASVSQTAPPSSNKMPARICRRSKRWTAC